MTAYADLTDVYALGLSQAAMGNVSVTQQQSILDAECDTADGYLRGRYQLPLLAWGKDLRMNVAKRAMWEILRLRGFNPESGADIAVRQAYEDAVAWFDGVQRGAIHPNVTPSAPPTPGTSYAQPQAFSRPPRGW